MVHFVGAGSGAPDLITLRGARLLDEADVVIYAGSLVNPELLTLTKPGCEVHDSAKLTLEEVIALVEAAERMGKTTVRLHTGDPSIYGAVREQFDELDKRQIAYDVCPGASAFCGSRLELLDGGLHLGLRGLVAGIAHLSDQHALLGRRDSRQTYHLLRHIHPAD